MSERGKRAAKLEAGWTWTCRTCAVVGYGVLLTGPGFSAPTGAYLLLLGLFFGPEVVKGQLRINRRGVEEDSPR